MTIEEFKDELRQLARDGKEKELEKKSQEVQQKFETMKAEFEWMEPATESGGGAMTYNEASDILVTVDRDKLSKRADELFRLVRKAINKQVPLTPDIYGDGYADGVLVLDSWKCPNCEKSYEIDYDKYDYCPCCGQCIDWSDYEEGE